MQPYFFPYMGYWQLINAVDKFIILDDVNYIKKGWINRNRINMDDREYMFTLPIKNVSQNKKINEVEIYRDQRVINKILRSFECCYSRSEYFDDNFEFIKKLITYEDNNLSKYLEYHIREMCKYLEIDTEIIVLSQVYNNKLLKGQDRIIDICCTFNADEYINPIGGKKLYSKKEFEHNGIKLNFLDSKSENMYSIIDCMVSFGRCKLRTMLSEYELL